VEEWLGYVEGLGEPDFRVALPSPDDLIAVLIELAVPHEDIDAMVALRLSKEEQRLLRLSVHGLVRAMGSLDEPPRSAQFPGPYLAPLIFVAARPHVRAHHRERRIPVALSRLILADLGRNMAVHRRRFGTPGLDPAHWVQRHFRGMIYQLGRLQFELINLGDTTAASVAAADLPWRAGDVVLSVHIPDYCGPLSPQAVSESLRRAAEFFPRHFPEHDLRLAVCHSWLLDPQLAEHLPPTSNILAFQRRFHLSHVAPGDSIARFVRPGTRLGMVMERHVEAGGQWQTGSGWLVLTSDAPRSGAPRPPTRT
jgi:hypothetical protein